MADQSGGSSMAASGSGGGGLMREYRKGNWTVQETMVLIEGKKMDDERRLKRASSSSSTEQQQQQQQLGGVSSQETMMMLMRNKPAELRWKWVEDYCWRRGCFRSQNQCNDKWDNLMRDYKKVRDYERKVAEQQQSCIMAVAGSSSLAPAPAPTPPLMISHNNVSYWSMEKAERKNRGLPSNMLPQIYEALVQVVEKKGSFSAIISSPSTAATVLNVVQATPTTIQFPAAALSSPLQQTNVSVAALPAIAGTPPPLLQPQLPFSQPSPYQTTTIHDSSDSDTSSDSPAKRRRKDKGPETRAAPSSSSVEAEAVANAISRGASSIIEAIQASEGGQERRHRELMGLSQRRLEIEESSVEVNRQGMNGLVGAINNLSNSILALAAAASSSQTPPPPR